MKKVAFVCVGNAFRSQIAEAFLKRLAGDRLCVISGGTRPVSHIDSNAVQVMREKDIDISGNKPKAIQPSALKDFDYVITMGCGEDDICPANFSGKTIDWDLPDPKGKDVEFARRVRDEIEERVRRLLKEMDRNP